MTFYNIVAFPSLGIILSYLLFLKTEPSFDEVHQLAGLGMDNGTSNYSRI